MIQILHLGPGATSYASDDHHHCVLYLAVFAVFSLTSITLCLAEFHNKVTVKSFQDYEETTAGEKVPLPSKQIIDLLFKAALQKRRVKPDWLLRATLQFTVAFI